MGEMEVEQFRDGFRANERGIAREHDDVIVGRQGFAGGHQGVARAALRLLQDETDTGRGHGFAHAVGLVADDGVDMLGLDDLGGRGDDMGEERLAPDFVQDLGMFRLQARAFARRHNGDRDPRGGFRGLGHSDQYTARDTGNE